MKKILIYFISVSFLFIPFMPTMASWDSFSFRSTVLGENVRNTGSYVYKIVNQKNNFNSSENVYVLSRVFSIDNIDSFQFKQVLYHSDYAIYKTLYSPVYRPYGQWWAETYSWVNFGRLPAGDYHLKTYIKTNNGYYKEYSNTNLWINSLYQNNHRDYYHYTPRYSPKYQYKWTQSDNELRHNSGYIYSLDNPKTNFSSNENVVVLTKLSNIRDIDNFQIKHELFRDGRNRYKILESPVRHPGGADWEYNYNYVNFGSLPIGDHTVKVFIRINGGSWKQIDTVSISVNDSYYNRNYYYPNYSSYDYDWTRTGNEVNADYYR